MEDINNNNFKKTSKKKSNYLSRQLSKKVDTVKQKIGISSSTSRKEPKSPSVHVNEVSSSSISHRTRQTSNSSTGPVFPEKRDSVVGPLLDHRRSPPSKNLSKNYSTPVKALPNDRSPEKQESEKSKCDLNVVCSEPNI